MNKRNVCILFGGVTPEHEVSLRSAECILTNIDRERNNVFAVGITRKGEWLYFPGSDYSRLPADTWMNEPDCCRCIISPSRGDGLILFQNGGTVHVPIDVVFPVMHGANGEDGSIQGLMQIAGIPCVGPGVAASACCMDKTQTKLIIDRTDVSQAKWHLVTAEDFSDDSTDVMDAVEERFEYPVFVKPAGTGSSVGVAKAHDRKELLNALILALKFDRKVLVEEFIPGREIEIAVLGNHDPVASICGEIISGAEFYDYDAKYITDTSRAVIPADLTPEESDQARAAAITVYKAMGCRGLSRVDFFVTDNSRVVFNEINTLPGFTSISMYPKLFVAGGMTIPALIERILELAEQE